MTVPHRIVLRIGQGIAEHFPIRVSEWVMTYPLIGWGLVLWADPSTFERSASFSELARWWDESTWAVICLNLAVCRLAALVINGTFKAQFPYSPHLRGFAAFLSCIFWGQVVLGVLIAAQTSGGAWTGFVAYTTFMALDVWNMMRAWADIGTTKANREPQ